MTARQDENTPLDFGLIADWLEEYVVGGVFEDQKGLIESVREQAVFLRAASVQQLVTSDHNSALRACPFCGREPALCDPEQQHPLVSIGCFECGMACETQWLPKPDAIAAWNTRALAAPSQAVVSEAMVPRWLEALQALVASCEQAFTCEETDHPDDVNEDVSSPGLGITFGQIWRARDSINCLTAALHPTASQEPQP